MPTPRTRVEVTASGCDGCERNNDEEISESKEETCEDTSVYTSAQPSSATDASEEIVFCQVSEKEAKQKLLCAEGKVKLAEESLCCASAALWPFKRLFNTALFDLDSARKDSAAHNQDLKGCCEQWAKLLPAQDSVLMLEEGRGEELGYYIAKMQRDKKELSQHVVCAEAKINISEEALCKASEHLQPYQHKFDLAVMKLKEAREEAVTSKQQLQQYIQKSEVKARDSRDPTEYEVVRAAVQAVKTAKKAYEEAVEMNVSCFERGLTPAEANKLCDAAEAEMRRTEVAKDRAYELLIQSS